MDVPIVPLNDIALFVEVARRKSFSQAAKALDMPMSTLSRRIRALEQTLGLRLINRNTRRLELTDAGMQYVNRCEGLIDELEQAREQVQALSGPPQGRLNISMPYSLAIWLLPESLGEFSSRYPGLECEFDLNLRSTGTAAGLPFDLILSFGHETPAIPNAVVRKLISLNNYLYASADYLKRHGEPKTPAELRTHQCLRTTMDEEHSYWVLNNGSTEEKVSITGVIASNNMSVNGALSGLSLGITRMPQCQALEWVIRRNDLKRILPDWHVEPISIYAIFPSRIIPAKTQAFLDFMTPMLGP